MKLRLTEPAKDDLLDIWQYLAPKDPDAAERLMRMFHEKFELLLKFPNIGKERHDLVIGIRAFPAGKYLIIYQPSEDMLEIVRVRHGSTNLKKLFDI